MFAGAAAIVAGSRSMASRLEKLGASPNRVITNYVSTVDTALFTPTNCATNPPRFIAVGRFVEKKAPHLTLLAFSKVVHQVESAELVLIGDGHLKHACEQIALALGLRDNVRFIGECSTHDVRREMRLARCFVQHSVHSPNGDREGTSISVLEAASTGLAIVATRHEGIAETMIDGHTALLVDEHDVEGMAAQMLRMARDPQLAGELGRNAAHHVRKYYTMEQSIDRLSRVLDAAAMGASIENVRDQIEADYSMAARREFALTGCETQN
jgi:glycosyltransferase involved in cell wall biosynthesis